MVHSFFGLIPFLIKQTDIFGHEVKLMYKGKRRHKSWIGGLFSIAGVILLATYLGVKLNQVFTTTNIIDTQIFYLDKQELYELVDKDYLNVILDIEMRTQLQSNDSIFRYINMYYTQPYEGRSKGSAGSSNIDMAPCDRQALKNETNLIESELKMPYCFRTIEDQETIPIAKSSGKTQEEPTLGIYIGPCTANSAIRLIGTNAKCETNRTIINKVISDIRLRMYFKSQYFDRENLDNPI